MDTTIYIATVGEDVRQSYDNILGVYDSVDAAKQECEKYIKDYGAVGFNRAIVKPVELNVLQPETKRELVFDGSKWGSVKLNLMD